MRTIKLAAIAALLPTAASTALAQRPTIEGVWKARGDGLLRTVDGKAPPLLPAAATTYRARRAAILGGDAKLDAARRCKPPGEPRLMLDSTVPFEIVVTKPRVLFGYQWNRLVRMVEMGPPRDVIGPTYFGQNAGTWEGTTLVVNTQALHDDAFLDKSGLPHSDAAHLIERFRPTGPTTMEARIHVDDPQTYARPWDAVVTFDRQPGARIREDICLEREGLVGKLR